MNRRLYKSLAYHIGKMKAEIHVQDTQIVDKFVNDIIKNVLSNSKDFDRNQFMRDIEDARSKFESQKSKCTRIIYRYRKGQTDNIVTNNTSTNDYVF